MARYSYHQWPRVGCVCGGTDFPWRERHSWGTVLSTLDTSSPHLILVTFLCHGHHLQKMEVRPCIQGHPSLQTQEPRFVGHHTSCLHCPLPVKVQLKIGVRLSLPCCCLKVPGFRAKSYHRRYPHSQASGPTVYITWLSGEDRNAETTGMLTRTVF